MSVVGPGYLAGGSDVFFMRKENKAHEQCWAVLLLKVISYVTTLLPIKKKIISDITTLHNEKSNLLQYSIALSWQFIQSDSKLSRNIYFIICLLSICQHLVLYQFTIAYKICEGGCHFTHFNINTRQTNSRQ